MGKAAKEARKAAGKTEFGLNKDITERAVRSGLRDSQLKSSLPKYELSLNEIKK